MIGSWLKSNYLAGLKVGPMNNWQSGLRLVPVYAVLAGAIGFGSGMFQVQFLTGTPLLYLPITLFLMPSFLEESFFRGILIPNDAVERGRAKAWTYILISTAAFVLWHPLNALLYNHAAASFFFNPWFLLTATLLGLTCGYSYVHSRSLWQPILIHWLTVVVWVIFLGGRNMILDSP